MTVAQVPVRGRLGVIDWAIMRRLNLANFAAIFTTTLVLVGVMSHCASALETFPTASLAIATQDGLHEFTVEVATTSPQHAQGLMFRRKMAAGAGMVFVYQEVQRISMWMKNTLIPLDMVFIGDSGKIIKIAERTTPMSQEIIASGGPVKSVLELNGGTASRLGIRPGDRVTFVGVFD